MPAIVFTEHYRHFQRAERLDRFTRTGDFEHWIGTPMLDQGRQLLDGFTVGNEFDKVLGKSCPDSDQSSELLRPSHREVVCHHAALAETQGDDFAFINRVSRTRLVNEHPELFDGRADLFFIWRRAWTHLVPAVTINRADFDFMRTLGTDHKKSPVGDKWRQSQQIHRVGTPSVHRKNRREGPV